MTCGKDPVQSGPQTDAAIYERGGGRPAAGAIIKLFPTGDTAFIPAAICTTDARGRYSVKGISTGEYDLWADKDSFVVFHGSIAISPDYTTLSDDTLKPASSISGIIAVQFPHDPRTITIRVLGTDKGCAITHEDGTFTINGLAAGSWSLLFQSSLPGYMQDLKNITVAVGARDTFSDTLRLYSMDLPFVSGVRIKQDTLAGTIRISWERTSYKNCLDYVVFRALCSDVEFSKYPLFATQDTVLVDTIAMIRPGGSDTIRPVRPEVIGNHDDSSSENDPLHGIDSLNTAGTCYRYRIAVRTWNQEIGPTKGFVEHRCAPRSFVTTYFTHNVEYPAPQLSCMAMIGRASLHDTVALSIHAKNLTRQLGSVSWYDPLTHDTVATKAIRGTGKKELRDTIRYAFDTLDTLIPPCLIAVVSDEAGDRWYDTISVAIIEDVPYALACPDTGVFVGTTIRLSGSAVDYYNSITGWEWKIGSGPWMPRSGPDTSFTAPLTEGTIVCSLAVINDDGGRAADEVRVFTSRRVKNIAANISHTLFLKDDGTLWSSGSNYSGQLGDGSRTDRDTLVRIMSDVKSMCAGGAHTLILKTDGSLWGCGDNSKGQLGDSVFTPQPEEERGYKPFLVHSYPVLIMTDVLNMAAGSRHSLILKTDKSLWACGDNASGQLGDGTMTTRYSPVNIMSDVQDMAAGELHSILLKNDGTVLTCGSNQYGQLGIDSTLVKHSVAPRSIARDAQGVYAGFHYTLVLKNDKTLWGCGYNEYGQLGDTSMQDRYSLVKVNDDVRSIVAGAGFSMTVKADGALWVCGWNYYGNWGNGSWEDRYMPSLVATDVKSAAASLYYGLVLKNDGSVWTYGISEKGAERIVPFMDPSSGQGSD